VVKPQISFAVPYYRGTEYLRQALTSLQKQTLSEWEAVVVDDAGPEPADDVVRDLSDSRIRYERNSSNLGLAGNWNRALQSTSAPLVTILHADDVARPEYAATMVNLMTRHPAAAAGHCRAAIIDEMGRNIFSLPDRVKDIVRPHGTGDIVTHGPSGLAEFVRGSWIYCPTLCFRRELFPPDGFDGSWKFMVDFDLLVRLIESNATIVGSRAIAFEYRRHSMAQSSIMTEDLFRFKEELDYYELLSRRCESRGWSRAARIARHATMIRLNLLSHGTGKVLRGQLAVAKSVLPLVFRRLA
jgi:glycosyltransferase involved in cell wall biosynthesis